jgi:predicted metal-dependent phosphoesterase TrpH
MSDRVDLHIHSSKSSDGDLSPFHLLRLASENGFRAISISDHDTVEAYPEALRLSREAGVELIPSVELTTLFDGREFHLLLPFVAWNSRRLKKILDEVNRARVEEAQARIAKLQDLGFDISWKEVNRKAKSTPPLGVTIAQVLLEKGLREDNPSLKTYLEDKNRFMSPYLFYQDYFMEGRPAYVPKRTVGLIDVLEIIADDGAVPVLAHPGAYFERATKEDLVRLKEAGLAGLEVYTTYHDTEQTRFYKDLAEELDLAMTAGSDFHGHIKPHIPFGFLKQGDYRMVEELKKRQRN